MILLHINGKTNPIGIDTKTPEFSWGITSSKTSVMQVSYHILVQNEDHEVMWDSGRILNDRSVEIKYDGKPLEKSKRYIVDLVVLDNQNDTHISQDCYFETGLFLGEQKQDLGDGSIWIGADELTLDATSACYFAIEADMKLLPGSTKVGLVFGADDHRLKNKNFNPWGIASEVNYIHYEVDFSDYLLKREKTPLLKIYVVGMPTHKADGVAPNYVIPISETILNRNNQYEPMTIRIDTLSNANQLSCHINGHVVDDARQINPLGNTHDYNTFPNLNKIGFAVAAGECCEYTNLKIINPGPYSEGLLFGNHIGATYAIFKRFEGVTVGDDGKITVDNSFHKKSYIVYADPSYGSAPMLRTTFHVTKPVKKARLYASALGIYNLYLNGSDVSDDWFNPGNAQYRERIPYQSYEVDLMIRQGENVIAVQLGEGWWSGYQSFIIHNYNYYGSYQGFMAKLVIDFEDGSQMVKVTDELEWQYSGNGPIEYGSFFQGERYNAKKEMSGWMNPGFNTTMWKKAVKINIRPELQGYSLVDRKDEPVRIVKTITSISVRRSSEHMDQNGRYSYLYDMGENVIGVPKITLPKGMLCEGETMIIRYGEVLYPDNQQAYIDAGVTGMIMAENYRAALSTDFYTAKDSEEAIVMPKLTFHGFRYIEISGLPESLPLINVTTQVLSSVQMSGSFECSNPLVNRLYKNIMNSQCSNFVSLPTDCPQRNERLGWTGDAQVFSLAASYNAQVYEFYRQWLFTLRDEQRSDGSLPVFAPSFYPMTQRPNLVDANNFFSGVTWDAAIIIIPYHMYVQYGKTAILQENIEAMKKYLKYLMSHPLEHDGIVYANLTSRTGILADWLGIEVTDPTLINNAVYVGLLELVALILEILLEKEKAIEYHTYYQEAKRQWNMLYVAEDGRTQSLKKEIQDTQASYVTPLRFHAFDEKHFEKVLEHYRRTITRTETTEGTFTIKTGFSGTPHLLPVLSANGLTEDAYKLFESKAYASWLYPVVNGATSIWERWNSYTVEGGFNGNNSMNSFNHFSLGAVLEWMMQYQLGIASDPADPGFKHIILQPQMGGTLTYSKGSTNTLYGRIHVEWTRKKNCVWSTYTVTVPANTYADLYLPSNSHEKISVEPECNKIGETVHNKRYCQQYHLKSGTYHFVNESD